MIPAFVERCAGIDVGKKLLVVCVVVGPAHQEGQAETRKFGTIRSELEKVRAWLKSEGCTHVRLHACGDGEYRLLLEAGTECSRRRSG